MGIELPMPELERYLHRIYPQTQNRFTILRLTDHELDMQLHVNADDIRPGGTLSGPCMFTLVDCAFYALVLSQVGEEALAVTTNVNLNFMRKPLLADLTCTVRMLKKGRGLCMGDAMVYSEKTLVAQASVTYSIPPR
ncbi:MAG: PaaI family thioesterase [Myxococcota bacterium]|nr:PaaI family thioesterase [Myxococcota bacterium]